MLEEVKRVHLVDRVIGKSAQNFPHVAYDVHTVTVEAIDADPARVALAVAATELEDDPVTGGELTKKAVLV